MLNAATRTVRGGASPNFISAMNNDDGLSTKRNTPPFSFPQEDKTGAHSIAALDRFICDSKNGSIYSDSIKASIGEKPEAVNPNIPTEINKPLPRESFRVTDGRLANSCNCGLNKKKVYPQPSEGFCGCDNAFMDNAAGFMQYAPIVIIVLVLFAAFLVARIIIYRKDKAAFNNGSQPKVETQTGGVIDTSFDSII